MQDDTINRARGCLFGQLAGDSLGSLVEFQSPGEIARRYPEGVRNLADGGTWNTIAGQPTDDSELALALARTLVRERAFHAESVSIAYRRWLDSHPFDCGNTIRAGLSGRLNHESQANGALMRASPIAIFGAGADRSLLAEWAAQDARLTHPNPVCVGANIVYVFACAEAIARGPAPSDLYETTVAYADDRGVEPAVRAALEAAATAPPRDFTSQQGWVLVALQNAFYRLVHADDAEAAIVATVGCGGDTDTNAAICGALVGAVYGMAALPRRWTDTIVQCRPEAERAGVVHPRPEEYWPVDAAELAAELLQSGR